MNDIILMTYIDKISNKPKLPHIDHIKKSNPNSQIHIVIGKDSGYGKYYDWKNSDQQLRLWLKENIDKIGSDQVAIIEWDTLITKSIPDLPETLDLASKTCLFKKIGVPPLPFKRMRDPMWTSENWMWWREIPLLDLESTDQAIGLISFGFYHTRKWVLEKILDVRFDKIFGQSIQNELRFPTVAGLCGAKVGGINLPFLEFYDVKPQKYPGIYHGVNSVIS